MEICFPIFSNTYDRVLRSESTSRQFMSSNRLVTIALDHRYHRYCNFCCKVKISGMDDISLNRKVLNYSRFILFESNNLVLHFTPLPPLFSNLSWNDFLTHLVGPELLTCYLPTRNWCSFGRDERRAEPIYRTKLFLKLEFCVTELFRIQL